MKSIITLLLILVIGFGAVTSKARENPQKKKRAGISTVKPSSDQRGEDTVSADGVLMTFYELGSVKCIPCRQMQPVMKSIGEKYGNQLSVVFYDVWKEDQKHYAEKFSIQVIPTQVFVDRDGKEVMRHQGFLPEKDIDAFLQSKGLQPKLPPKGS